MSFFNPFRSAQKPSQQQASAPQGQPLELVKYDTDTGKFSLGQKALGILREVPGPVGVVAVCGRARQGKSFILNQLLGQSTGFQVSSTHRPCTKGLWMWSTPVERKNADGSKYHLVLLDTEGIDAYDQTGQYSTQIFCLAVLLSSLFVYNQMGGIDEAALDRLSLVTEMTKHIRVRANTTAGEDEAELSDFTPSFLWLLRDFYLTLEEDGRQLTPREYLETALKSVSGQGSAVEAKNKIRESIKTLFPNRDCFSMVRPMSDESQLAKLESIPPNQMRPQFVDGMKRLTRLIFMRAQPKRVGNKIITGTLLAALATEYVEAINSGAVPTIATAWQGVAEAECRRAADLAEEAYRAAWDEPYSSKEKDLDQQHQICLRAANQAYDAHALGDSAVKQANERTYMARLNASFSRYKQERMTHADSECRKMITTITQRLTQLANQPQTKVEDLQACLKEWESSYTASAKTECSGKWKLHADFIHSTYQSIVLGVIHRQAQQAELAQQSSRAEADKATSQLQQIKNALASTEAQLQQAQQNLHQETSRKQQAESRAADLESQLTSLKTAQESDKRLSSQQSTEKEAQLKREYEKQLASLQQQAQAARLESSQTASSSQQQRKVAEEQLATLQRETQALRERLQQAELQHKTSASGSAQQTQQISALQADLQALQAQLSQSQAEKRGLSDKVADLETRLATSASQGAADVEEAEGYETPDEDKTAHLTPAKMTVNQIKDWLTENGHEEKVWTLTSQKAKKPRFVDEMNSVLGRQ